MASICLDASVILDWLLPTSRSAAVDAVWTRWTEEDIDFVGPPLLFAEVTSVLREWVFRRGITREYGQDAFQRFCDMDVRMITYDDLHMRAWQLATSLNQPRAYDAQYLAVAEREGCEFWTTDRRLYNSVYAVLPWVRVVTP